MALVIQFGNDKIVVNTSLIPFDEALSAVKSTIGRVWDKNRKIWKIPFNEENFQKIKHLLPNTQVQKYEKIFNQASTFIKEKFPFLRPYQAEAVSAILQGKRLIALPLGSGKTFVALAYLKYIDAKKSLIIVPASLLYQWQKEAKEHFNLDSIVLEGDKTKRTKILSELKNKSSFILILNYEKVILDDVKEFLYSIPFDLMILDEAHKIKNSKTKTYKALKRVNSASTILLTATPLVNSPFDIFNLVNFIYPGFFFYPEFAERYIEWKEITIRKNRKSRGYEEGYKVIKVPEGAKNLKELHERLKPVIFFKAKEEILKDLPPKTEQVYWVKPTRTQVELFEYYYDFPYQMGEEEGIFLTCLNLMRQVADSTELLISSNSPYAVKPASKDHPKIDLLKEEILPFIDGKVIIFTEYERMAQILKRELKEYNPFILVGGKGSKYIDKTLDAFRESDSKVLISTDVINYGKNLQYITTLIHYDLPWSPAIAQQREGRIHRIGQESPVTVIKLITLYSVEEKIFKALYEKSEQFKTVIAGGKEVDIKKVVELVWERKHRKRVKNKNKAKTTNTKKEIIVSEDSENSENSENKESKENKGSKKRTRLIPKK